MECDACRAHIYCNPCVIPLDARFEYTYGTFCCWECALHFNRHRCDLELPYDEWPQREHWMHARQQTQPAIKSAPPNHKNKETQ